MSRATFLSLLLGGQLLLVSLDLWENSRLRRRDAAAPVPVRAALFLGLVIVIYGLIQVGGLALVPSGEQILAQAVRHTGMVEDPLAAHAPPLLLAIAIGVPGFYLAGFWDYAMHRFVSHSRMFWFTHENHHLPTRVSTYMPGMCVRPFAAVTVFPATLATVYCLCVVLAGLGLREVDLLEVLYAVVLVQSTILGTSHSAYLRHRPAVHRLMRPLGLTTPQEHRLHHAADLDGNFGNFTTLWDRVFGTYLDPALPRHRDHQAGLAYDQDFLGAVTAGLLKLPAAVRQRYHLDRYCRFATTGPRSLPGRP